MALATVVWCEGLKADGGRPFVCKQYHRASLLRWSFPSNFVKPSEDFFEHPGEPVARTLRAFRGLLTDVLALICRLRAYSLRLFGCHFRTPVSYTHLRAHETGR